MNKTNDMDKDKDKANNAFAGDCLVRPESIKAIERRFRETQLFVAGMVDLLDREPPLAALADGHVEHVEGLLAKATMPDALRDLIKLRVRQAVFVPLLVADELHRANWDSLLPYWDDLDGAGEAAERETAEDPPEPPPSDDAMPDEGGEA